MASSAFYYATRNFITVFAETAHWSVSPEPDEFSRYPHILLSWDIFQYYPPVYAYVSQIVFTCGLNLACYMPCPYGTR